MADVSGDVGQADIGVHLGAEQERLLAEGVGNVDDPAGFFIGGQVLWSGVTCQEAFGIG